MTRRYYICDTCKARHQSCFSAPSDLHQLLPCTTCERLGVACVSRQPRHRLDANEDAEWRIQIGRLNEYLGRLAEQSDTRVRADDLIDRLTRFCFADACLQGTLKMDDLLFELTAQLNDKRLPEAALDAGGFVLETSSLDLKELTAALPPWEDMEAMLLQLGKSWVALEGIYTPATIRAVENLYAAGLSTPPHAHQLADVFAMLMILEECRAHFPPVSIGASGHQAFQRVHQERADRWRLLCLRALEIGHHLDDPSIMSLRAFCLSSLTSLSFSSDTGRVRAGLVVQPLLLAMVYQMGLNEEPPPGQETPVERYERRALATKIIRYVWYFSGVVGSPSMHRWNTFTSQMPEPLSYDDLPADDKYEDFRADAVVLHGVDLRTRCALLCNEFSSGFFGRGELQEKDLKEMAGRIRQLTEQSLTHDWQPGSGPIAQMARIRAQVVCFTVVVQFNQHFCRPGPGVDLSFHRGEIIWALECLRASMSEYGSLVHSLPNVCFAGYDSYVCAAVLLSPLSDDAPLAAEQETVANEVLESYFSITAVDTPRIPLRLARTVQFLIAPPTSCREHCSKKARTKSRSPILSTRSSPMGKASSVPPRQSTPFTFATDLQLVDRGEATMDGEWSSTRGRRQLSM